MVRGRRDAGRVGGRQWVLAVVTGLVGVVGCSTGQGTVDTASAEDAGRHFRLTPVPVDDVSDADQETHPVDVDEHSASTTPTLPDPPSLTAADSTPPVDDLLGRRDDEIELGQPGCLPPSPSAGRSHVVVGTSKLGLDVLAWLYLVPSADVDAEPGLVVDVEHKIVWSVGAEGDVTLTARGPSGQEVPPFRGPTRHTHGSSWDHDGSEWGSAFTFDEPGCWELDVSVDDLRASVWVEVSDDDRPRP